MRNGPLNGLTILLVEDDPIIAMDVEDALLAAGARVVGPYCELEEALGAVRRERFDMAVLDIDLGREESFPAAQVLSERNVPFMFYTGRPDRKPLRSRFAHVPVCEKPSASTRLLHTLEHLRPQAA